jgi:hypothetical protein
VNILPHTLRVLDEPERDDDDSPDVARCDLRPGTHTVYAGGIDTWICDECADPAPRRRLRSVANAWQDRDADDAGVPMYGDI